jgi:hypothetical protein
VTGEPQGFLRARVSGRSVGEGGGGPFAEPPEALTPERLVEARPGLAAEAIVAMSLLDGTPVFRFPGADPDLGALAEAVFVRDHRLYQITLRAPDEADRLALLRALLRDLAFAAP